MNARPIPYPADTHAKGWRFEIDHEKLVGSDAWDFAGEIPMAQGALLMLWLAAWRQDPCGSLPSDPAVIRAKCKVPAKLWPSMQEVLMRDWWLAEDGRLYHDLIVPRVLEMMTSRRGAAERTAASRARRAELAAQDSDSRVGNGDVTRDKGVSNAKDTGEFGTSTRTSSSSSLRSEEPSAKYPPEFEAAWLAYPKRPGASKAEAAKAWKARVKAGVEVTALQAGVERYAGYCKASSTAPQFIKHAATFFGPDEHYLSDWTVASLPAAAAGPAAVQRRADFFSQTTNTGDRHAEPDARTFDVEARAV